MCEPLGFVGGRETGPAVEPGRRASGQEQRFDLRAHVAAVAGGARGVHERAARTAHVAHVPAHASQVGQHVAALDAAFVRRQVPGELQRAIEPAGRLAVREAARFVLGRHPQIRDRPLVFTRLLEVLGKLARDLARARAVDLLDAFRDAMMQAKTTSRRQQPVERFLVQRVDELIARRPSVAGQLDQLQRGDELAASREAVEAGFRGFFTHAEAGGDGECGEVDAADAGRFERLVLLVRQPRELRLDHLPQRLRRRRGDGLEWSGQLPPIARPRDNAARGEVLHQVPHEQRIAVRALMDQAGETGWKRMAGKARVEKAAASTGVRNSSGTSSHSPFAASSCFIIFRPGRLSAVTGR